MVNFWKSIDIHLHKLNMWPSSIFLSLIDVTASLVHMDKPNTLIWNKKIMASIFNMIPEGLLIAPTNFPPEVFKKAPSDRVLYDTS